MWQLVDNGREKIIIIEEEIKAVGKMEILIDGNLELEINNNMLAGLGYVWAYGLHYGTSKMIQDMFAHQQGSADRTELSTPARTAGGRGANSYVTVQSTWTNNTGAGVTFDDFWLTSEPHDIQQPYLDIARVDNDSILVPNLATMTINWTIDVPSTSNPYTTAQRNYLAQAINPEGAPWGGTIYYLSQGEFTWAAGASGVQATHQYFGGDGFTQELTVDCRYTHAAAAVIVLTYDQYNSNMVPDLVHSSTGWGVNLGNLETVKALHKIRFLGE